MKSDLSKGKFLPKHKATVYSTGIASFDNLTGGGLVGGQISLFEEDYKNNHCKIFSKHFISCSLSSNHKIAIILEENVENYTKKLPKVIVNNKDTMINPSNMDIAWRYNTMKSFDDEFPLNINDKMDDNVSSDLLINGYQINKEGLKENLNGILQFLREFIKKNGGPKTCLKIFIGSFASDIWGYCQNQVEYNSLMTRFLHSLRHMISGTNIVVMMTIKAFVDDNEDVVNIAENLADYVFKFEAFEDLEATKEMLHNDISGKMQVRKIPCINTFTPVFQPNTDIWSYTVRKTRMVFKEFSLPPCLSETTSRTNQAGSVDASQSTLKSLDF